MTGTVHPCSRLRRIWLCNLLSFGPDTEPLDLENINVLVGPNGAGKSNLIEAIALMRSASGDIRSIVCRGGSVGEWIWKGEKEVSASIDFVFDHPQGLKPLRHLLSFRKDSDGFRLEDERIENETKDPGENDLYFFYRFNQGYPTVNTIQEKKRSPAHETVDAERSILAQRRDPEWYPELSYLADIYEKIRIYREWSFGRNAGIPAVRERP